MHDPWRVRFVRVDRDAIPSPFEPWADPDGTHIGYVHYNDAPSERCDLLNVQCPWCGRSMGARFRADAWSWDGDLDRPTVGGSLRAIPREGQPCAAHFFVRDGQIIDAGTPPHGGAA